MNLQVTHETMYRYTPAVETAQHMAFLRPADSASQQVLHHELTVLPAPADVQHGRDVFGNHRSFFSLQTVHDTLAVRAITRLRTRAWPLPLPLRDSSISWEVQAERFRYRSGGTLDAATEFTYASPFCPIDAEFSRYAAPSFAPRQPLLAGCIDLMARIYRDFAYDPDATHINTPALQALAERRGVCQDFAHIMIACLRSLGLAARYVSGYVLTHAAPGSEKMVGADASHAWLSVYLGDFSGDLTGDLTRDFTGDFASAGAGDFSRNFAGSRSAGEAMRWCDFDPTNNRYGMLSPGADYLHLAHGRDFSDVSPLRGVIHGGAHHTLRVAVTVEELATPSDAAVLARNAAHLENLQNAG